jgi:hypothetical protein
MQKRGRLLEVRGFTSIGLQEPEKVRDKNPGCLIGTLLTEQRFRRIGPSKS